jgi:hypothetical protein
MLRPFNPHPLPFVPFRIHNNCSHGHHLNFLYLRYIVISFSSFAFPFDFGPFKMLDSASEVLLKVVGFLRFWFNLFAVSFEVFFWFVLSQQLQYPAKEYLITCCCLLCRSCYWCRLMVLSVERCQTQTPSFQSLWQFHFQEGSKEVNPK